MKTQFQNLENKINDLVVRMNNAEEKLTNNATNEINSLRSELEKLINEFSNAESKIQMKQAIIRSVDEVNISKDICIHVLNDRSTPSDLTQHILQMYSMNQLFFTDSKPEKINHFNRTLNLQWAIDIKNSLSANGS